MFFRHDVTRINHAWSQLKQCRRAGNPIYRIKNDLPGSQHYFLRRDERKFCTPAQGHLKHHRACTDTPKGGRKRGTKGKDKPKGDKGRAGARERAAHTEAQWRTTRRNTRIDITSHNTRKTEAKLSPGKKRDIMTPQARKKKGVNTEHMAP